MTTALLAAVLCAVAANDNAWIEAARIVAARALAPVEVEPLFTVTRRGPGAVVKTYPGEHPRHVAEIIARNASEKHRGAVVEIAPARRTS